MNLKDKQTFTLSGDDFAHTINSVVFAAAKEQTRDRRLTRKDIDLQDVCFEIQLGVFRCIATDATRMSIAQTSCKSTIRPGQRVTMYRTNAKDMARMYRNSDSVTGFIHKGFLDEIDYSMAMSDDSGVSMKQSAFYLNHHNYLNWRENVQYSNNYLTVELNTKHLLTLLRDMFKGVTLRLIPSHLRGIKIEMVDNKVTISPGHLLQQEASAAKTVFEGENDPKALKDLVNGVEHEIHVDTPEPHVSILLNARYLIDVLQTIRDDTFILAFDRDSNLIMERDYVSNILKAVSIFNVNYKIAPIESPYYHMIMPMNPDATRKY